MINHGKIREDPEPSAPRQDSKTHLYIYIYIYIYIFFFYIYVYIYCVQQLRSAIDVIGLANNKSVTYYQKRN